MKRIYSAKRNALITPRGISWGMGALLFSLLVVCIRFVAPNIFWEIVTPILGVSESISTASHSFFARFDDAAMLSMRVSVLTDQNAALSEVNATLSAKLAAEEVLLGGTGTHAPGVLAGVVARPPMSPYDTLVLSVGKNDGVTEGMEAFGPSGVPVGVISSVLPNFSQLTLFSSPNVITNGWIGKSAVPVLLRGKGGGVFSASLSRSAAITVGDTVYAPGPGELPIGRVTRIDSDQFSPSSTLSIAGAVNPFSLTQVELRATGIAGVSFATSTLP
jgi:hypothetical protein